MRYGHYRRWILEEKKRCVKLDWGTLKRGLNKHLALLFFLHEYKLRDILGVHPLQTKFHMLMDMPLASKIAILKRINTRLNIKPTKGGYLDRYSRGAKHK